MTLAGIRHGDIVRVAGGYGMVVAINPGRLHIEWLGTSNLRPVKAREVEAHWRRTKK